MEDERGTLTYHELLGQAQALAIRLRDQCKEVDSLIAVRLPKGRQQAIACLGILIAGGAYLPLDIDWPKRRCLDILQQANAKAVISVSDNLKPYSHISMDVEAADLQTLQQWAEHYIAPQQITDLAYVIFTSGSTGKPKGVAIEHRSAVNTLLDINERFGVCDSDKVLAVSALSFDLRFTTCSDCGLLAAALFSHRKRSRGTPSTG